MNFWASNEFRTAKAIPTARGLKRGGESSQMKYVWMWEEKHINAMLLVYI